MGDGASNKGSTRPGFSVQQTLLNESVDTMPQPEMPELAALSPRGAARLGFDLAQVSAIARSLELFGERFRRRLFTERELEYADSGSGMRAERLAARFAAKEAVIKALGLAESGIGWRDIEVVKRPTGECAVALHGRVAELAAALGAREVLLSMSHDGDYAGAVVTVSLEAPNMNPLCGTNP
jgi:holo-[acyl-carrier protein] synthase